MSSELSTVSTPEAPAAIGPYSQAVKVGSLVFVSLCGPLLPESGNVVDGGIKEQTKQVLLNIKAILEASGSSLSKVAKTSVFLKSLGDFVPMNQVYEEFFQGHKPARACVEVSRIPKDSLVAIECIAAL